MAESEKKSSWRGMLMKKAGGFIETSKIVAKNVKTAAQEWKEAKADVMPQHLPGLNRDPSEFRKVSEFKELAVTEDFEGCVLSLSASEHEVKSVLWVMRRLKITMQQGGFLTPTLFVPKEVWYQDVVKISSFQLKLNSCQEILQKLRDLRATAKLFDNEHNGVCKALVSLSESIEVIQAGMVFQVSGVEEQESGNKEGLDKLKTLSYSFAKTASRIAHSAVDVTKLTHDQNKGYLGVLTALFDESQYLETLLSLPAPVQRRVSSTSSGTTISASSFSSSSISHPAGIPSPPFEDTQILDVVHPASLIESDPNSSLTIHTNESTTVSDSRVSDSSELVKLLVNVTKLLSRTILRFVVDDLFSRLKAYHLAQVHLFVDCFE